MDTQEYNYIASKIRLDTLHHRIYDIQWAQRKDLLVMHLNAKKKWAKVVDELTVCNQIGKLTPKFEKLQMELEEILNNIDHHITLAISLG